MEDGSSGRGTIETESIRINSEVEWTNKKKPPVYQPSYYYFCFFVCVCVEPSTSRSTFAPSASLMSFVIYIPDIHIHNIHIVMFFARLFVVVVFFSARRHFEQFGKFTTHHQRWFGITSSIKMHAMLDVDGDGGDVVFCAPRRWATDLFDRHSICVPQELIVKIIGCVWCGRFDWQWYAWESVSKRFAHGANFVVCIEFIKLCDKSKFNHLSVVHDVCECVCVLRQT